MEKILVINPGSTSTKIAVYEGEIQQWVENIPHSPLALQEFALVYDQLEMRHGLVLDALGRHGDSLESLDAVVSRGGSLPPIHAGAYQVTLEMLEYLEHQAEDQHPSNVGPGIAFRIAKKAGVDAYIYDGITVDEMEPIHRITGLAGIRRPARGHNLNMRAAARKLCREKGIQYDHSNLIVVHLGGGITAGLHSNGKIVDLVSDGEGPFSPERAGGLPAYELVKLIYEEKTGYREFMKKLQGGGGMMSHFGTGDMKELEGRIEAGDGDVELVYDAMTLAVAKNIGKLAVDVAGAVDYILLTGGIAFSKRFTRAVMDRVGFLAPVAVLPGEYEMEALAKGALEVLRGEETARKWPEPQP